MTGTEGLVLTYKNKLITAWYSASNGGQYVYSYNTNSGKPTNLLKFSEEDSEAFTYIYGNILYTNIGKNKLYCYNMTTKKNFSYNRSASIPKRVAQNGSRVVILNDNGSISWCGTGNASLQADWYLTTDEQWYEF